MKSQKEKAIEFRKMHSSGRILVLPNAWDVPSARIYEECGFQAVATSSGGVSVSLGYPDGQKIPLDEMLSAVSRIARAISVPLSADMEAGFAKTEQEIEVMTGGLIATGAIGLNIEDETRVKEAPLIDLETQLGKIKAIKRTAESLDVPLVINARTDAYRFAQGDEKSKIEEVIRRGNAYKDAGADCVFAFGVLDPKAISEIVKRVNAPVNIRAGRGSPSIQELQDLGVARASIATGPICSTLGLLKRIAIELRDKGTYESLVNGAISYEELNKLTSKAQ